MEYQVTAYVNVWERDRESLRGRFERLAPTDPIAEVGTYSIKGVSPLHAAEGMFTVGNRMGCDIHGAQWPSDVRSLSVGDLIRVVDADRAVTILACASMGWDEIPEPANPIVPLPGTNATSRK